MKMNKEEYWAINNKFDSIDDYRTFCCEWNKTCNSLKHNKKGKDLSEIILIRRAD